MNIYERKYRWKIVLVLTALVIVAATLIYTDNLATKLAAEERQKVTQIANVYHYIATATDITDYGFFVELIQANKTVPIISTDNDGNIVAYLNLDTAKVASDTGYLQHRLEEMKEIGRAHV